MKKTSLDTHPIWMETALPEFKALDRDIETDVVVVGGGLTGITTAYLLREAGVRVVLVERGRLAAGDTGHSTAHLTYVTDDRLHELAKNFGKEGARAYWEGGIAGINEIGRIAAKTGADCEFRRVPGYLHDRIESADPEERNRLEQDLALAHELKFKAAPVENVPYANRYGICFEGQAKFHPRKYLAGLLDAMVRDSSPVFENTTFEGVEENPLAVRANGKRIRCDYIVIATHTPLMCRNGMVSSALLHKKLTLYTSYVLGASMPQGTLPEALFWDTSDPYDFLRVDSREDHQYAIFGGDDVKTGEERDAVGVFRQLEQRFMTYIPEAKIQHRWMGRVVVTDDGLPFIGENADREFIATGFCGNGFTLGTLAAMMARDRYLRRKNPWFEMFRIDRSPLRSGFKPAEV